MKIQYIGLEEINGPLAFIKTPKNVSFEEKVNIELKNGEKRIGNIIKLDNDITTIQVYEGTNGINSKSKYLDKSTYSFFSVILSKLVAPLFLLQHTSIKSIINV